METGTIKKKTDKGFGFISTAEGDVFFHSSGLEGVSFDQLNEGDAVQFEMTKGPKGPKAEHVSLANAA